MSPQFLTPKHPSVQIASTPGAGGSRTRQAYHTQKSSTSNSMKATTPGKASQTGVKPATAQHSTRNSTERMMMLVNANALNANSLSSS